jgi:hypothetical protein
MSSTFPPNPLKDLDWTPPRTAQAASAPVEPEKKIELTRADQQLCAVGGRLILLFVWIVLLASLLAMVATGMWLWSWIRG